MADNDKLYITISDARGEGGGSGTPTPKPNGGSQQPKESENDIVGRYIEHEMFHLVKSTATQAVNFAMSNIGNLTGDYTAQRKINEDKQLLSNVMRISMMTIGGAKVAGGAGAVAGLLVGTISMVASSTFEVAQKSLDTKITNHTLSMMRDRVGLNTKYDGSRGTEN